MTDQAAGTPSGPLCIETPVTRLLGTRLPIHQAAMSWAASSYALPLAVTEAGGLGTLALGPLRLPDAQRQLAALRAAATGPYAVNIPLYRVGAGEVLDLVVANPPPVFVGSQGGAGRYVGRFKGTGTICLHVVASVEHACKAMEAGVDGLVVVGGEAGGHPPGDLVSTLVMVRAVVRALPGVPVVASGGVADGAGLAAVLALGAGAAQLGTRFIATPEANVHAAYKQAVLAARPHDTRTIGRGLGGVIRAIDNDLTREILAAEEVGASLDERRALFAAGSLKAAALEGDVRRGKVEAGQSVGLVEDLLPATEVVARLVAEYAATVVGLPHVTVADNNT